MSAGVQEMIAWRPARPLWSVVRSYSGYTFEGLEPGTHQGLPSGNLTFIIGLGDPIDIVSMPGDQAAGSFDALVGGLHLKPATVSHQGHGAGISVEVSPLASRALFGIPAAAFASHVVELDDLVGGPGRELVDRLNSASAWRQRFTILDDVLAALVRDGRRAAPEVTRAWDLLVERGGQVATADLAREVGYSRRRLTQLFAAELGVGPKAAARVIRFERTCGLLDVGLGLAEAAVRGGYYDQAHLANEWNDLAGTTPTAWLHDELRDRNADEDALVVSA